MTDTDIAVDLVSAPKILVIEDEPELAQTMVGALERSGMRALWASNGAEGLRLKSEFLPDVVLVDLNLPDTDGIALVSWLAKHGQCAVIVVSGLADEADRILGLELGADDYITKPPRLREMLARIRAVHRRVKLRALGAAAALEPACEVITVGSIRIDMSHRAVHTLDGVRINLTSAEFAALEAMLAAKGQPVSRDRLCQAALNRPWRPEDRSVDQLIFNLRQKLSELSEDNRLIHSIRGAGYLLASGRLPGTISAVA